MHKTDRSRFVQTDKTAVLEHVRAKVNAALRSLDGRDPGYDEISRTTAETIVRDEIADLTGRRGADRFSEMLTYVNDDLFGLGPIESLLRDAEVTDVMIEGTDIFVVSGNTRRKAQQCFTSLDDLRRVIDRITYRVGKRVDMMTPHCDCDLYDGSRCHIIIPPAADRPYVSIRKLGCMDLEMADWVERGAIARAGANILIDAVRNKKNVILAGGTGAGKTTLLNSLAKMIEEDQIIVTLEDTYELKIDKPHVRRLLTRCKHHDDQSEISFSLLIKNAMRMNPDRLIMGEVRDEAAYDLLHALNTGHKGSISTVHANSAVDALWRIETLAAIAKQNCSLSAIRRQVSRVIDLVVFVRGIEIDHGRYQNRRIMEICQLTSGLDSNGDYLLDVVYRQGDA